MARECCICFNDIDNEDIFDLECCNNAVHQDCINSWLKSSIDNRFTDYNKCILCKRYNKSIDNSYKQIRKEIKVKRNSERVIIVIDRDDNHTIATTRPNLSNKMVLFCTNAVYIVTVIFTSYVVLDIFIHLSHL
jgi:hypothetical protein